MPTPTLVQHVSSSSNPVGVGISGKNYVIPLPNACLSGNCLILGITYPNGSAPTSITDPLNGTWPAATVTADAGVGNYVAAIVVLHNIAAGQTTVTVNFSADVQPFQYTLSEFTNLATASTNDKSTSNANVSGTALTSGSFTPASGNNANGGNLIWNYYALASGAGGNPTTWTPGGSFALLSADIAWTNSQGFPHATQSWVQGTSAGINPGMTSTGDSTDTFNCVAVSIEAASAGSAPAAGIHINAISRQTMSAPPATWALQFPCTGTLLVMATSAAPSNWNITSITDSKSNTWVKRSSAGNPQIWDAVNATPDTNLKITIHSTAPGAPDTVGFWDISGAATSPFDVYAAGPGGIESSTTITDTNVINPTTTNGLVIGVLQLGQGPGLAITSPTGAIWTMCTYTDETDMDLMENADGKAHLYNAATGNETWTWTVTNTGAAFTSSYASYKAAPLGVDHGLIVSAHRPAPFKPSSSTLRGF